MSTLSNSNHESKIVPFAKFQLMKPVRQKCFDVFYLISFLKRSVY